MYISQSSIQKQVSVFYNLEFYIGYSRPKVMLYLAAQLMHNLRAIASNIVALNLVRLRLLL